MKNRFFVSAVRKINLVYSKNGKLCGNRFELKLVFSSQKLDKNGFVVDFSRVEKILANLEAMLKEKNANSVLEKDEFSFGDFLAFIADFVDKSLNEAHILIEEVSLSNDEEGYALRFD